MRRRSSDAYLHGFRLFLFGLGFTGRLARLGFIIVVVVFLSVCQPPRALLFRSILRFDGIEVSQCWTKLLKAADGM